MKKSNKISFFYIITSLTLLLVLVFGGVYGIYVSVGLSFVRNSAENVAGVAEGAASNVSFGGTVNFDYSMAGIIILSIALVILAIFDLISLIRQIVLFKQFKMVKNSSFEKGVEKKVKSKGIVIFFAVLVDLLSVGIGIVGIFLNGRSFAGHNMAWLFYIVDILIIILAVMSIVFLIMKLKALKGDNTPLKKSISTSIVKNTENEPRENNSKPTKNKDYDIDEFEYKLLKLKNLKNSKVLTKDEYEKIRNNIMKDSKLLKSKPKEPAK